MPPETTQAAICKRITQTLATAPVHDHLGYEALAYLKLPGPNYYSLLQALHDALRPKLYVEIGVRRGDSLRLASPETRCVAIDPMPVIGPRENTLLAVTTSDAFFDDAAKREKARGFDLALIDGDHSFEQALRDFENLERLAKPSSIICLHDVIPMDERTATPKWNKTSFWTGDVWRLMASIVANRDDLVAFTVACPPTGLGIVGRFGTPDLGDGGVGSGFPRCYQFPERWKDQVAFLNIVPNEGIAIAVAFQGKAR
jgi:hypothetical protein